MSGPPKGRPVRASWSLQGKAPGQVAYDVQAGNVDPRIAQKYFWDASTETPRPDRAHAPDALPWVAFLGGTEAGGPVTGLVETTWSGGRDATGRISYSARLLLLDWQPTSGAGLTWTSLYNAALDAEWPAMSADAPHPPHLAHPPHIVLDAAPADVAQLARYIDQDIRFEWAARCAALLLEGRHVAITLSPEHAGLNAATRVAVLDGICALLPYGSRAWLSAATWAGHGADHELRLTFALRPRGNQCHAVLAGQPPQEPGSREGRAYLAELLRLRRKVGIETLLTHLLSHRAPLSPLDAEQALRHLRDLDLRSVVVADIDRGTGRLGDVSRLLSLYPLDRLPEGEAAMVARHLALSTLPGGRSETEREQARSLLLEHWSPRVGRALADELNSWPVASQTLQRVCAVLDLATAAGPRDRRAHAVVLAGYLDGGAAAVTPEGLSSRSQNLHALRQGLDEDTAAAVRDVFVRRPELTLAWLDFNAGRNTLDDLMVRELLHGPDTAGEPRHAPDWLRGAAALIHHGPPATAPLPGVPGLPGLPDLPTFSTRPTVPVDRDALDAFAGISTTAWRTGLRLACHARNPDALSWLHPELYEVATGRSGTDRDREFLLHQIDILVPKRPGLPGAHAAWADLLQLLLLGRGMQRSRLIADDGEAAVEYAAVLRREVPQLGLGSGREAALASGLVGERLDQIPYRVLWELTRPQVESARTRNEPTRSQSEPTRLQAEPTRRPKSLGQGGPETWEGPLLDRIAELLANAGDWITHGMPAQWEQRLRTHPGLQWLAHTAEIRRLAATRTTVPETLGDAIVRASPNSRYARSAQQTVEYPSAVLEAITPWLHDHMGRADAVHRLAGHLNRISPQRFLGDLLYYSIAQPRFGELVRQRVLEGHEELRDGVEQAIKLLRQKPSRRQPTAPVPTPGRPYGEPPRPVPGSYAEPEQSTPSVLPWWRRLGGDRA
ncbi:hypothetical protein [Streptomyces sp. 35G-GA-8]|uniref:hypothetical protein n=1 Tax=Streptomyces sp. 35G-GA-8 TaxID=2939434 RepID=UPI00201E862E|nr:hypothetical protein [Streptomyces sp. 35G-GA-8]MCL7375944.1 hypothetical protein [Streptomyces sp. 35G-GA-8]